MATVDDQVFGPRDRLRTNLRMGATRALLRLARLQRDLRRPSFASIRLPEIEDRQALADLAGKVNWYLADTHLPVVASPGVRELLRTVEPNDAPHLAPGLVHGRLPNLTDEAAGIDPILLETSVDRRFVATKWPRLERRFFVDPGLARFTEEVEYRRLRAVAAPGSQEPSQVAIDQLFELEGSTAVVLGTGPSAGELDLVSARQADVRVVCNSAVRNQELLDGLQPNVITFADAIFHFGPSRYAATFRADVCAAVERTDALIVCPEDMGALLLAHEPTLRDRVVPIALRHEGWETLSPRNLAARTTGNVLTQVMLPIAFALADRVQIAGCDGRKPDERYYWRHNASVQYSDELMRTVFESHPSFFRDQLYADYYDRHCRDLEGMLQWAEARGKQVESVTSSYIPALVARSSGGAG